MIVAEPVPTGLAAVMHRLGFTAYAIMSFIGERPLGTNATIVNGKEGLVGIRVVDAPR